MIYKFVSIKYYNTQAPSRSFLHAQHLKMSAPVTTYAPKCRYTIAKNFFKPLMKMIVNIINDAFGRSDITTCEVWQDLMRIFTDCAELLVAAEYYHFSSRREEFDFELRLILINFFRAYKMCSGLSGYESVDYRKALIHNNLELFVDAIANQRCIQMFSF